VASAAVRALVGSLPPLESFALCGTPELPAAPGLLEAPELEQPAIAAITSKLAVARQIIRLGKPCLRRAWPRSREE